MSKLARTVIWVLLVALIVVLLVWKARIYS